jgi:hypothetical protein
VPFTPEDLARGALGPGMMGKGEVTVRDPASRPTGEPLPQPVSGEGDGPSRGVGVRQGVQHDEVMNDGLEPDRRNGDTGLPKLVGVSLALVAQHVRLAGDDERRREPLQLLAAGP